MLRFRLRLPIYPPPQLLQTAWCFYHFTPALPCRTDCPPVRALPSPRVSRVDHQYYDPIRLPGAVSATSRSRLYAEPFRRDFFAGCRGSLQFPHTPSFHVAADTPPVGAAASDSSRAVPAAFARYRPSRPPDVRVTRLHLRSHYTATWNFAHLLSRWCRRASPFCFRATVPPTLRGLESLGLGRTSTDWVMRPLLDAPISQRTRYK
jgi:hypothetical protein